MYGDISVRYKRTPTKHDYYLTTKAKIPKRMGENAGTYIVFTNEIKR